MKILALAILFVSAQSHAYALEEILSCSSKAGNQITYIAYFEADDCGSWGQGYGNGSLYYNGYFHNYTTFNTCSKSGFSFFSTAHYSNGKRDISVPVSFDSTSTKAIVTFTDNSGAQVKENFICKIKL